MLFISSSLLSLLLISSCHNQSGCKKVELSSNELAWFQDYSNGDTIFFKSQKEETDTFILEFSGKVGYTQCNKFELGQFIYPVIYVCFQNCDHYAISKRRKDFYMEFSKSIKFLNSPYCAKSIQSFELNVPVFDSLQKLDSSNHNLPELNANVETYSFLLGSSAQNNEGLVKIMKEFAISKVYGLIWYRTIKGDFYQRIW